MSEEKQAVIDNYPTAPSVNKIYKTIVNKNSSTKTKTRRVCSKVYTDYKSECEYFNFKLGIKLTTFRNLLKASLNTDKLKLNIFVRVSEKEFYNKKGKIRKKDYHNIQKPLLDQLAITLGIDDKHFIDVRIRPLIYNKIKLKNTCKIVITSAIIEHDLGEE